MILAKGWDLTGEYVDNDVSASKDRGEGTAWARMLADIAAGRIDVVVAVDLDRLIRRIADLTTLIDSGAKVLTVDGEIDLTSADGEFRATMLAGIGRFEARRKGERQSRANVHRAGKGVPFAGGVRLTGYTQAGEVIEEEAALVRSLFTQFAQGETLRGLRRWLEETGVPNRQGGAAWNPSSVRGILENPRYAGRVRLSGEVMSQTSTWATIVDPELYDRVQRKLTDPGRRTQTGNARKYLGSGLWLCGTCGRRVTVISGRYFCRADGEGGHVTRNIGPVDTYVVAMLRMRLEEPDLRQVMTPATDGRAEERTQEREQLLDRLARIENDYDADLIDGQRYAASRAKVLAALDRIEEEEMRSANPGTALGDVLGAPDPVAHFDAATIDRQRAIAASLMTVRLHKAPRGRRTFDDTTVSIEWAGGPAQDVGETAR